MIKDLLVKLGIGSASVDLKVPLTTVEQGDTLDVEVTAEGGVSGDSTAEEGNIRRT